MAIIDCDMGEGFGLYRIGDDAGLMPLIDVANVACGFHASDFNHMRKTVQLAKQHGVKVGAHPSLPDLQGFGRREMKIGREELVNCMIYQIGRDGIRFHPGVEYRHLCVVPADLADATCVPPHDLTGKPAVWPTGPSAPRLRGLMEASQPIVRAIAASVGSVATQVWLWGQGTRPSLPRFVDRYATDGRLSSAVDLVRGLGVLLDLEVVDVPGATAGFDNDYAAQRDACLASLVDRDLFVLHVEATDEAGHQGDVVEKVTSLERWDAEIIGPIVEALGDEAYRVLLLPDHATPCALQTHTSDPVPYLLFDSTQPGPGGTYSEAGVAGSPPVAGHALMARLLA